MNTYPYAFYVVKVGLFRHRVVMSDGKREYPVSWRMFSKWNALYIAEYLTQWYRTGFDTGRLSRDH